MKKTLIALLLAFPCAACAQQVASPLPAAPGIVLAPLHAALGRAAASPAMPQASSTGAQQAASEVSITRSQAEAQALKSNPRITASQLLALASGQVTREVRSNGMPQIAGAITAVKAEDASRIGAGELNASRLYTHAGTGGTLSQLLTDFGHTSNLIANAKLLEKAQQQDALATEQDVLLATDQAFYRLLDAQSLLDVARATVNARGDVEKLTEALTKSALKSDLDLNVASANYSQAQLIQLDAQSAVSTASAALAALLAAPADTRYRAVEGRAQVPPPPENAAPLIAEAQNRRPDLQALRFDTEAQHKLMLAERDQYLPTISAMAIGGVTPVRPDGIFQPNWYAAGGVNLELPLFTGFRISAQTKEARLREQASAQQAKDLADNIARDVQTATLAAQAAFERIGVAEKFRSETAQALSLAQTRYKLGLSSIVELSQAQLESTQAEVTAVNARYDYLMALRSLDYARGALAP